jgi:hypothetical protein
MATETTEEVALAAPETVFDKKTKFIEHRAALRVDTVLYWATAQRVKA